MKFRKNIKKISSSFGATNVKKLQRFQLKHSPIVATMGENFSNREEGACLLFTKILRSQASDIGSIVERKFQYLGEAKTRKSLRVSPMPFKLAPG